MATSVVRSVMASAGQAAWSEELVVEASDEELRSWLPKAIETAFGVRPAELERGRWRATASGAGKYYDISVTLQPRDDQQVVSLEVKGRRAPLATAGVVTLASLAAASLAGVAVFATRYWREFGPAMGIPAAFRPLLLILPALLVLFAIRAIRTTRLDVMAMVPRAERFARRVGEFDAAPRVAGYRSKQRIAVPGDSDELEAAELEAAERVGADGRAATGRR